MLRRTAFQCIPFTPKSCENKTHAKISFAIPSPVLEKASLSLFQCSWNLTSPQHVQPYPLHTAVPPTAQFHGDAKCVKDTKETVDKLVKRSFLRLWRLVREVLTSEIGGNVSELCLNDDHLMPPHVPYLWEAMQEISCRSYPAVNLHKKWIYIVELGKENGQGVIPPALSNLAYWRFRLPMLPWMGRECPTFPKFTMAWFFLEAQCRFLHLLINDEVMKTGRLPSLFQVSNFHQKGNVKLYS